MIAQLQDREVGRLQAGSYKGLILGFDVRRILA